MDEDFDFDDGGGSPEDYGMTQADFDAATEIGQAAYDQPTEDSYDDSTFVTASRGPSYVMGSENLPTYPGTNITDYSSLDQAMNQAGYIGDPAMYTYMRGATATNPFPDSIFSKLFGAENVDYSQMPGFGGIRRVQEINDLRYRQAMGLPSLKTGKSYTDRDFYIGQPTLMGEVKPLDEGIGGLLRNILPFGIGNLVPARGLPENDPRFIAAKERETEIFKPITDFVGDLRTAGGDLIDRFYGGIGSLERRFRDAITPRNMTDQGVSSLNQRQATEADENVAEALQLVPQVRNFSFTPVDKQFLNRQPVDPRLLNQLELINQNRENRMRAQLGV